MKVALNVSDCLFVGRFQENYIQFFLQVKRNLIKTDLPYVYNSSQKRSTAEIIFTKFVNVFSHIEKKRKSMNVSNLNSSRKQILMNNRVRS